MVKEYPGLRHRSCCCWSPFVNSQQSGAGGRFSFPRPRWLSVSIRRISCPLRRHVMATISRHFTQAIWRRFSLTVPAQPSYWPLPSLTTAHSAGFDWRERLPAPWLILPQCTDSYARAARLCAARDLEPRPWRFLIHFTIRLVLIRRKKSLSYQGAFPGWRGQNRVLSAHLRLCVSVSNQRRIYPQR